MDVYIQHEPTNIKDFLRLFNASGWRDSPPIMGIPQIVDVLSKRQDLLSDKNKVRQWPACREDELAKRPCELAIVVCIHYHHSMGGRTTMVGPRANRECISAGSQSVDGFFKLSRHAFEIARQGTYPPIHISFEDLKYEWQLAPMNVENHIKFINGEIRCDIENGNQLQLGTKLPEFEKQMISGLQALVLSFILNPPNL